MEPARFLCPWGPVGKNTGVGCHSLLQGIFPTQGLNPCLLHCRGLFTTEPPGKLEKLRCYAVLSCLFMSDCDPMDYSLPGSSVYGILQARILEWAAIPFSRGSFQPRDWTQVSHIAGRFFTVWATRKPKNIGVGSFPLLQGTSWPRNQAGSPALQADSLPAELPGKPEKLRCVC